MGNVHFVFDGLVHVRLVRGSGLLRSRCTKFESGIFELEWIELGVLELGSYVLCVVLAVFIVCCKVCFWPTYCA